jgi:hypothetical protein
VTENIPILHRSAAHGGLPARPALSPAMKEHVAALAEAQHTAHHLQALTA